MRPRKWQGQTPCRGTETGVCPRLGVSLMQRYWRTHLRQYSCGTGELLEQGDVKADPAQALGPSGPNSGTIQTCANGEQATNMASLSQALPAATEPRFSGQTLKKVSTSHAVVAAPDGQGMADNPVKRMTPAKLKEHNTDKSNYK